MQADKQHTDRLNKQKFFLQRPGRGFEHAFPRIHFSDLYGNYFGLPHPKEHMFKICIKTNDSISIIE